MTNLIEIEDLKVHFHTASGTIKAILIENGQPVEYGQPLFIIA